MDYKQKYNEALERAKEWMAGKYGHYVSDTPQEIAEFIFPELKESWDEQIRKELLEHCINRRVGKQVCVDANDYRRWADWLEKQGQSKKTSIWKHWKDGIAGNGNDIPVFLIKNGLTYSLSSCLSFECDYIELSELDSLMLEKQGEQKSQDKSALEAIKEEKVEPKFKVSKWYQCTKDFFGKCVTFDKNTAYYCAKEGCLQDEYGCHIAIVKDLYDNFKLWTIEDAKDGDVLVSGEVVFIFKVIHGVWLNCHCSAHKDGSFNADSYDLMINKYFGEVQPATKEQRDFLFQKMKEEGYELDKDTKVLNKVTIYE